MQKTKAPGKWMYGKARLRIAYSFYLSIDRVLDKPGYKLNLAS